MLGIYALLWLFCFCLTDGSFLWQVPLKFTVCGKTDSTVTYLLKEKSGEVVITNVGAQDVIKVSLN